MANIVLGIFAAIFFICILTGSELLYALGAGFFLFVGYGLYKKYSLSDVLSMAWKGVMSVRTIFIVFMLIGMLTGVWRASGTIAYIITLASDFIEPSIFILIAFLLNCAVSFLLGTSFGTSATMGVITMSIGMTIGMPPAMVGGAILAGVYFGDRMSPVSTSALLVSVLTEVDLYTNIRNMAKSAVLPFLISCVIYFALGEMLPDAAASAAASADFEELYIFSPILALPAVSILLLSFFRVPVKTNMAVSIALAALLSYTEQAQDPWNILFIMIFGYVSPVPELAPMVNGGGIVSMLHVAAIVCLSASFSGISRGRDFWTASMGNLKPLHAASGIIRRRCSLPSSRASFPAARRSQSSLHPSSAGHSIRTRSSLRKTWKTQLSSSPPSFHGPSPAPSSSPRPARPSHPFPMPSTCTCCRSGS